MIKKNNLLNIFNHLFAFFTSIDKYSFMVICLNIFIFYILQFLFFYFIIEKQYLTLLLDKANILLLAMKENTLLNTSIKLNILSTFEEVKQNAEISRAAKDKYNLKLIITYFGIPLSVILGMLLISIIFFRSKRNWTKYDTINVFMIILAYITEIYFFFMIVQKYNHIGDIKLIHNILKSLGIEL